MAREPLDFQSCTLILRDAVQIEEAISVAKAVSNSDSKAVLFVLMPMIHSATDKFTILKHKRTLEDALMESLGAARWG